MEKKVKVSARTIDVMFGFAKFATNFICSVVLSTITLAVVGLVMMPFGVNIFSNGLMLLAVFSVLTLMYMLLQRKGIGRAVAETRNMLIE